MAVLEKLQPKEVFYYFEEISKVPRCSYHTKLISDYCVEFAKKHGLRYEQDAYNNVIIYKDGTPGYEKSPVVMIQGHLDMVGSAEEGSSHDFTKDPLQLAIDEKNQLIYAKGTTLGGDDGIAVAYIMAILADDSIEHPPLEAVLTVDEEVGLEGAQHMDLSSSKAKYLLNIDSEEEGILCVSCAGGLRGECTIPVERTEAEGFSYTISAVGFQSGHSGIEINQPRANAIKIMGRVLNHAAQTARFSIVHMEGGTHDNVIPKATKVDVVVPEGETVAFEAAVNEMEEILKNEYRTTEKNMSLTAERGERGAYLALNADSTEKVIFMILQCPNGVRKMSAEIEGLVQTSLNLGIVKMNEEALEAIFYVRSSVDSEKEAVSMKLKNLTEFLGGDYHIGGDYPGWEYRKDSRLRDLMIDIYEEMFGEKPETEAVHAGLECGVIQSKVPTDIDCISFGPDMRNVHSVQETLSIPSTERTWNYIKEILKQLK